MIDTNEVLMPDGICVLAQIICQCGTPEESFRRIINELERCEKPLPRQEKDWPYDHIVACLCDHANMTSHGSSLSCAWLTDEGKICLSFLRKWGDEWFDQATMVDKEGVTWGHKK